MEHSPRGGLLSSLKKNTGGYKEMGPFLADPNTGGGEKYAFWGSVADPDGSKKLLAGSDPEPK